MNVCPSGKLPYTSKHEAKAAKRSCQAAAQRGQQTRRESRIYRCEWCSCWHLTSMRLEDYEAEMAALHAKGPA